MLVVCVCVVVAIDVLEEEFQLAYIYLIPYHGDDISP